MKAIGVIPARYASSRFPGKPLVDIAGKTMIRRVYERAVQAEKLSEVIIATDDQRIADHARAFGARVEMTRADHPSGTDRCAEVAARFPEADLVVNIQGDEPFIDPAQIDAVALPFWREDAMAISTLARRIDREADLFNSNVVKVVFDRFQRALYFSRHPIPFMRNFPPGEEWLKRGRYFQHLGIYAFRREVLMALARLSPGVLETAESLEQLRWMENGYSIFVGITEMATIGIDTPEDLEKARTAWNID